MAAAAPNITYSCTTAEKPEEIASLLVFLSNFQKHFFPRSPPADFLMCLPGQNRATSPSPDVRNLGAASQGSSAWSFMRLDVKAGSGSGYLLPRRLTSAADQSVPAFGRRPRFHRLLQWLLECLHGMAAGFPQSKRPKRPRRAAVPFVTQPQRTHTVFPTMLFRSHGWALTQCGRA